MIKMIHKFFLILIVECDKYCNWIRRPICGSDGTTYRSKCHMEVAACESDSDITLKHRGKCRRRDYESSVTKTPTTYEKSIQIERKKL